MILVGNVLRRGTLDRGFTVFKNFRHSLPCVCVTFCNPMYSLVTPSSAIYLLWSDVLGVFTTYRAPVKKSCVYLFIDMNNLRTGNMILTKLRIGGLHKKF